MGVLGLGVVGLWWWWWCLLCSFEADVPDVVDPEVTLSSLVRRSGLLLRVSGWWVLGVPWGPVVGITPVDPRANPTSGREGCPPDLDKSEIHPFSVK